MPDPLGEKIAVKQWATKNPDGSINKGTGNGGTTKEINRYPGAEKINDREVIWYDTPGIGDMDIQPAQLIALLEDVRDPEAPEAIGPKTMYF